MLHPPSSPGPRCTDLPTSGPRWYACRPRSSVRLPAIGRSRHERFERVPPMSSVYSLHQLGWRASYAQHLALDDFESAYPARVMAVHRSGLAVLSSRGHAHVVVPQRVADALEVSIAVGDWVLVENDNERVARLVERQSLIERIGAGTDGHRQSIAANVDTLFVVSSCNENFNPSRLERYLALAHQAGVEPVVVLTKADLSGQVGAYVAQAHGVAQGASVVAV